MALERQRNVAVNPARSLVFFETEFAGSNHDRTLCYNYKSGQWSTISAISDDVAPIFSINDPTGIVGEARTSGTAVELVSLSDSDAPGS